MRSDTEVKRMVVKPSRNGECKTCGESSLQNVTDAWNIDCTDELVRAWTDQPYLPALGYSRYGSIDDEGDSRRHAGEALTLNNRQLDSQSW